MSTLCGANCNECSFKANCHGCKETNGSPFGGKCLAAEYIKVGGINAFNEFKKQIIAEFNALHIEGMPEIKELYCLVGSYINLEYPLANGTTVKFLDDKNIYLGAQVECGDTGRCYGLIADMGFLLVCEYGENGSNPEIVMYKRR